MKTINAGVAYFMIVFCAGFFLGVIRTLLALPIMGETLAVVLELPIILFFSWIVCRWLIAAFEVPSRWQSRVLMGMIALLLLLLAEVWVSVTLGGISMPQHLAFYALPHVQIGLGGQVLFALFPVMQLYPRTP